MIMPNRVAGGLPAMPRWTPRALSCCSGSILLLGLGLILVDRADDLLALIPLAALGALLLFPAADLPLSQRLFNPGQRAGRGSGSPPR